MVVVVEITSPGGYRATKEYEVSNMAHAIVLAERELRDYRGFEVSDVWKKIDPPCQQGTSDTW